MVHMVAGGDFEYGEFLLRKLLFEQVTAKGAHRHSKRAEQAAVDKESAAHSAFFT